MLGSIFEGIATPTESSAIGCVGAIVLAYMYKSFSFRMIYDAAMETVSTTAMVSAILIGATAFSMVFTYTGEILSLKRLCVLYLVINGALFLRPCLPSLL